MNKLQTRILRFIGLKLIEVFSIIAIVVLIQILANGYVTWEKVYGSCGYISYPFIDQSSNSCNPENSIQVFMLAMKMLGIILMWLVGIGFVLGFVLAILFGIYWLLRKWIVWNWRLTK